MPARISPSARRDLREIATYIVQQSANRTVAKSFVDRLQQKCHSLADSPFQMGVSCDHLMPGLRSYASGNYLILFRYSKDAMEIIRIIESHRDIGRIFH